MRQIIVLLVLLSHLQNGRTQNCLLTLYPGKNKAQQTCKKHMPCYCKPMISYRYFTKAEYETIRLMRKLIHGSGVLPKKRNLNSVHSLCSWVVGWQENAIKIGWDGRSVEHLAKLKQMMTWDLDNVLTESPVFSEEVWEQNVISVSLLSLSFFFMKSHELRNNCQVGKWKDSFVFWPHHKCLKENLEKFLKIQ